MKIYFDVCCLNRPFDDQNQDRIHLEAEAVLTILKHVDKGQWITVSSDAVVYEINKTIDEERRDRLLSINNRAAKYITLNKEILNRATTIQTLGFTTYDAMHIACAEAAQADKFLTTDDKLLKKATKNQTKLLVAIDNPLTWLQEEFKNERTSTKPK